MLHYLVLLSLWTLLWTHPAHGQDECPPNITTIEEKIVEGVANNTLVYSFQSHYPDVPNRRVLVTVVGPNLVKNVFDQHFRYTNYIDGENGGQFWTKGTFDREAMARALEDTVAQVRFNVSVVIFRDTLVPIRCFYLVITVEDIDDNVPTFATARFSVTFNDDNHQVNESRPLLLATDDDEGINGTRSYYLRDNLGVFYLDVGQNEEMKITFVQLRNIIPLDRENRSSYQLTLVASEGNASPDTATLTVDVMIAAVCDEPPEFITSRYTPSLLENSTMGTTIINTTATDLDLGAGGRLTYHIHEVCRKRPNHEICDRLLDSASYPFTLDTESGILTLDDELDREMYDEYQITINAMDSCRQSATAMVVIAVEDVNDREPMVTYTGSPTLLENNIVSDNDLGFFIIDDQDLGNNSVVTIELFENVSGILRPTNTFEITEGGRVPGLKLRQRLDRESVSGYDLVIVAHDHGTPSLSSTSAFRISVTDYNDNPPVFGSIPSVIFLNESSPVNYEVVVLNTTDRDIGPNAVVTYELPESNSAFPNQSLFRVENVTGRLLVAGNLDREQIDSLSVLVVAHDNPPNATSGPPLNATMVVNITLMDINDEEPHILSPAGTINISEAHTVGNVPQLQVSAIDRDTPPHATLRYFLSSNGAPFEINRTLGTVYLTGSLDYDTPPTQHDLTIYVSDGRHNISRTVTIAVQNVNDEPPIFDRATTYETGVTEGQPGGTFVVRVTATDKDTPQNALQYRIISGDDYSRFRIHSPSGNITTTVPLNSEDLIHNYTLRISASDGEHNSPTNAVVFIMVVDTNEHVPEFFNTPYNFEVREDGPPNTSVGQVSARDLDRGTNGVVRYEILGVIPSSSNGWFSMHRVSGQIVTSRLLDRETDPEEIWITVEARDMATPTSLATSTTVRVTIRDVNDQRPVFSPDRVNVSINENYAVGNPFLTVHAVDNDIYPNNQTVYNLSASVPGIMERFHIDQRTGEIRLRVPLDYETENETTFEVVARDSTSTDPHFQSTLTVHLIVLDDPQEPTLVLNISTHHTLSENPIANHPIVTFEATNKEGNSVEGLVYNVTNDDGTVSDQFGVRELGLHATIYTLTPNIDRERLIGTGGGDPFFRLNVTATHPGGLHGPISSILTVVILDMNDNPPEFTRRVYRFEVAEDADMSDFIGEVRATDPDKGRNGTVSYSIHDVSVPFQISNGGRITLRDMLDFETTSTYEFTVTASDEGIPESLSSGVTVNISVTDVNDCSPEFDPRQNKTFVVSENEPPNHVIGDLAVTDCDSGSFGRVRVDIAPGHQLDPHFDLSSDGRITLRSSLDRETRDFYSFMVRARDGGSPPRETIQAVNISVEDYNDNPPVFVNTDYTVSIAEDYPIGVSIISARATDADSGYNSVVEYDLADYSLSKTFCINRMTGEIRLCPRPIGCASQEVVDYERQTRYEIEVIAYDLGSPRQYANRTVTVLITNVNEHPPLFDKSTIIVSVDEGEPDGTHVVSLVAYDWDFNSLNYRILPTDVPFRWENGAVVTNRVLDYSDTQLYVLSVVASESDGNRNGSISVEVFVNNVNNHAPQFEEGSMEKTISEQTAVGTVILTVHATDADNATNDAVAYSISSRNDNGAFTIDPLFGEISVRTPLDFETQSEYLLTIIATDTGSPQRESQPLQVTIRLKNENDERPIFSASNYNFTLVENSPVMVVGQVNATDRDINEGGRRFGTVSYSMGSNDYFTVDEMTGEVRSTGIIDRDTLQSDSIIFTVVASDGGWVPLTTTATVNVTILDQNDNPPQFSQDQYLISISPDQPVGVSIETLRASDLDAPPNNRFNYQVVTQPAGLSVSVSPTGELSLNQLVPQNYLPYYNFTVQATDPVVSSMSDSAVIRLNIETESSHTPRFDRLSYTALPVRENTPTGSSVFNVSQHASDADIGSNGDLTFSFASNYPKFSLDRSTGVITLRETLDFEQTKSYDLTVVATDTTLRSASATVTVNVTGYNDNTPYFTNTPTSFTLSHVPYSNVELFRVQATDDDDGPDGDVEYFLSGTVNFAIVRESGVVTNTGPLTSDMSYSFTIGVVDHGTPSKSSNISVTVNIRRASSKTPVFTGVSSPLVRNIPESFQTGNTINSFTTDPQAQSYHIVYQNASVDTFSLSDNRLLLSSPLDYEEHTQYQLILEARRVDQDGRYSSYLKVDILVGNVNDNSPKFVPIGVREISEDVTTGITLFTVTARDADRGTLGNVHYEIISGNTDRDFSINSATGEVSLATPLDRERTSEYNLEIRATDGGTVPKWDNITVHVDVLDVNDFVPTFSASNYTIGVYESPHTRSTDRIIRIAAVDEDLGPPLTYRLDLIEASFRGTMITAPLHTFSIHVDTGVISVETGIELDHETIDFYLLRINVTDRVHTNTTYLHVNILDVNDHRPELHTPGSEIMIWELSPVGTLVTDQISATDRDDPSAGVLYSLGDGWPSGDLFRIDNVTGVIRVQTPFHYSSTLDTIRGTIRAIDQGVPQKTAETTVTVRVMDVNDHAPQFSQVSYEIPVSTDARVGASLFQFNATDRLDHLENGAIMFRIPHYYSAARTFFEVSRNEGLMTLRRSQGLHGNYTFRVEAVNLRPYPSCVQFAQSSYANVRVVVFPINEHRPNFINETYSILVLEDYFSMKPLLQVKATDADDDAIRYSIVNPMDLPFWVGRTTGEVRLLNALDRESQGSYNFTIRAVDNGFPPQTSEAVVRVQVIDINDNRPVFTNASYLGRVPENSDPNTLVLKVTATDPDEGSSGRVTYRLFTQDTPFQLNNVTGEIRTTASIDYEKNSSFRLMVDAVDGGGNSSRVVVTVEIIGENEFPPRFTDQSYQFTVSSASRRGDSIGFVNATDGDGGKEGQLIYGLKFVTDVPTQFFRIVNTTGEIILNVDPLTISDDIRSRRQVDTVNNDYFLVEAQVNVTDSGNSPESATAEVNFQLHNSFTEPFVQTTAPPTAYEIIAVVVTLVVVAIVVFVTILVFALICQRRRSRKLKINDSGPMNNHYELGQRYSSRNSRTSTPSSHLRHGTMPRPEHTTLGLNHSSGSECNSSRHSYAGAYADDEDSVKGEKNSFHTPGLPHKPTMRHSPGTRSTSDLASTVGTDMLTNQSQDITYHTKAYEDIYARNAELLVNAGSQESIHMFGSEGGGEADGHGDIDDMLFAKFNDLEDDDSTTMAEEEPEEPYLSERKPMSRLADSRSSSNLDIPPVEERGAPDPYRYRERKGWVPRATSFTDTINQMASYVNDRPTRRQVGYPGTSFSQGTSIYGAESGSTQDSQTMMVRQPNKRYGSDRQLPMAHDYYGHYPDPRVNRNPYHAPRMHGRYDSATALMSEHPPSGYARDPLPPRTTHYSQEMHLYNRNHSHYMEHTPPSVSTPSDDGTVTPQRALADYDQNSLSSSSTSFASTNLSLAQQVRSI